jgi:hypothetical protein
VLCRSDRRSFLSLAHEVLLSTRLYRFPMAMEELTLQVIERIVLQDQSLRTNIFDKMAVYLSQYIQYCSRPVFPGLHSRLTVM